MAHFDYLLTKRLVVGLAFAVFFAFFSACEDDPILKPQPDDPSDKGSYGVIQLKIVPDDSSGSEPSVYRPNPKTF
jgi:hypothetical protein